jgi:transcriptional regulator|tara:strand:+ start:734 stop:946 length:213 start_codon:yes stop_codon:yes gene_type:complete
MIELPLNNITVIRTSLTWEEAKKVWLLRWSGDKQHVIAARLGTNGGRVADVLTEKTHVGSKSAAHQLRSD